MIRQKESMLRIMTLSASDEQSQPTDSRNIEARRWGEPIEANRRVVKAGDGKTYLARKGEAASAISISRSVATNPHILVDAAPYLGRDLPPVYMTVVRPIAVGALLYGADQGMVSNEVYGEPIARVKELVGQTGDTVIVEAPPATLRPASSTEHSGGRAAVGSSTPGADSAHFGGSPMSQRQIAIVSASAAWAARVAGFQSKGMTKAQAIRATVAQSPQLHAEFLAEQNARRK